MMMPKKRGSSTSNLKNNTKKIEKRKSKTKAVALLSGGLDSNLAVRMIKEQGIEVEAVAVKTPFCDFDCGKGCGHRVKEVASELGIKLKTVYFGQEYLEMIADPKYGYGSGMNPCIDCRSMMYNAAKDHMKKIDADFIITGEVLGQRPMSQNGNALSIIEKETKMKGKIIRPLSYKHLPISDAEKNGLIDRNSLGDIKGRSRKKQLELAKKYDVIDPPNSAGGCLLTDPGFAKRIIDLYDNNNEIPNINDVELLKIGRHFRISSNTKLIVGRDKEENEIIKSLSTDSDIMIEAKDYVGPTCILRTTNYDEKEIEFASKIVARYSDSPSDKMCKINTSYKNVQKEIKIMPAVEEEIKSFRIQ